MIEIKQCPICGGSLRAKFQVRFSDSAMTVHECIECHCLIKSPFFDSKELSDLYAHYEFHEMIYEPNQGEIGNIRARLERIQKITGLKKGKLLEVGCGRGFFLREAIKLGWEVEGLEFDGSSREHILPEVKGKVKFIESESAFNSITRDVFDVICSYQVFEHLMNPSKSLQDWTLGLKPGGLMVIQTPHAQSWGAKIHKANWIGHQRKEHFILFSAKALRSMYQDCGLQVKRIDFTGVPFLLTHVSPTQNTNTKKIASVSLFRFSKLTAIARKIVHGLGLGDNIEIYGSRKSEERVNNRK